MTLWLLKSLMITFCHVSGYVTLWTWRFVGRCNGNATSVYSQDFNAIIIGHRCCIDKIRFDKNGAAVLLVWPFNGKVHPKYLGAVVVNPYICLLEAVVVSTYFGSKVLLNTWKSFNICWCYCQCQPWWGPFWMTLTTAMTFRHSWSVVLTTTSVCRHRHIIWLYCSGRCSAGCADSERLTGATMWVLLLRPWRFMYLSIL